MIIDRLNNHLLETAIKSIQDEIILIKGSHQEMLSSIEDEDVRGYVQDMMIHYLVSEKEKLVEELIFTQRDRVRLIQLYEDVCLDCEKDEIVEAYNSWLNMYLSSIARKRAFIDKLFKDAVSDKLKK